MKPVTLLSLAAVLLGGTALLYSVDLPEMPPPGKEHRLLEQFVGEWESTSEIAFEPGKPPLKGTGTETGRLLGGFWMVMDGTGELAGVPMKMHSVFTLGFDPAKQKFVGTWIDSVASHLWHYEGTVDSTGRIFTLNSEGPCPSKPDQISKFKEVTEFKSKDHRVFTSSMQGEDGKWTVFATVDSKRKKVKPAP